MHIYTSNTILSSKTLHEAVSYELICVTQELFVIHFIGGSRRIFRLTWQS